MDERELLRTVPIFAELDDTRDSEPGAPLPEEAVREGLACVLRERTGRLLLHDPRRADQGNDPGRRRPRGHPLHAEPGGFLRRDGAARQRAAFGHGHSRRGHGAALASPHGLSGRDRRQPGHHVGAHPHPLRAAAAGQSSDLDPGPPRRLRKGGPGTHRHGARRGTPAA